MKQKVRKAFLIFCAIFFAVFSSLTYPMDQAKAGPLVGGILPGGITVGAGAYTIGALTLAGLVGVVGYEEYSDEINAHALGVWEGGTQTAKDSLSWSLEQARGAGNALVTFQADYINWMEGNLKAVSQNAMNTVLQEKIPVSGGYTTGSYPDLNIAFELSSTSANPQQLCYDGTCQSTSNPISIRVGNGSQVSFFILGRVITIYQRETNYTAEQLRNMAYGVNSLAGFNSLLMRFSTAGGVVTYGGYEADYSAAISKTREAWESMRDAGLVLPVDSSIPVSTTDGSPLTYNPTADNYTGIDGGVYEGTPAWAFPQPKIRVGQKDIPDGVYVDTPILTGNPAYDEPIIKNPSIPKTTTNVNTGVTIKNPDIPTTANPDIPIDPPIVVPPIVPPFDTPGTTGLDFTPLMMTGQTMTNKFPFSIPFDFVGQLSVLNVEPQAPSFDVNVPEFLKLGSMVIPFKMKLSFEMFDPVANIIRWGMIIIFDISLIFAIRKLLPE